MFQNAETRGIKKKSIRNGISRLSVGNFFAQSAERFSLWKTSVYQKSSAIEKFHA